MCIRLSNEYGSGPLVYWQSQRAASLPGPWTLHKLASYLDGRFRSRLLGAYWGRRLSMEALAPMFWVSSCTSLSLSQQRLFTTRPAAGWVF